VRDPFAQLGEGAEYVLTYSLPLALHMTNKDTELEKFIGVRTPRSVANNLISTIQAEENVLRVETFIQSEHDKLVRSIHNLRIKAARQLVEIAGLAKTNNYWEKDYHEADTKSLARVAGER
jgi:hypothetical protein